MKRKPQYPRSGASFRPILMNFSQEQLAGIGAVAMAYNAGEEIIDEFVRIGFRMKLAPKEILTRIGGIDGKIHLAKYAAQGMPDDIREALSFSLGENGYSLLKKYRDGVIHARIFDKAKALGTVVERRNREAEMLLTPEALSGLASRLELLADELDDLKHAYLDQVSLTDLRFENCEDDDPRKTKYEEWYQTSMAQYQLRRSQRLSLPSLPEFAEGTQGSKPPAEQQGDQSNPL